MAWSLDQIYLYLMGSDKLIIPSARVSQETVYLTFALSLSICSDY